MYVLRAWLEFRLVLFLSVCCGSLCFACISWVADLLLVCHVAMWLLCRVSLGLPCLSGVAVNPLGCRVSQGSG